MERIIGRIVEVKGLRVKSKLFQLLPPYLIESGKRMSSPRLNGFVKTRVGLDVIICSVVGEYSEEVNGRVEAHFLDLQVKGFIQDGVFVQGLRILPIVSSNIELLDAKDYDIIYGCYQSENAICLGNDLFDENKKISVNINRLIPSHIGVFGNTGSGKSNTLTRILQEYYDYLDRVKTKRGKFLIIDLNNEYGNNAICQNDSKIVYKLSTGKKGSNNKIPLDLKSLEEDDFVILMNASQKTQAPVVKNAYKSMHMEPNQRKKASYHPWVQGSGIEFAPNALSFHDNRDQ